MTRAKFITLEGLDGAGKTTHLEWLSRFLQTRGIPVRVTREPGGTPLGEQLRTLLLEGTWNLNPETETLLMFAARREHIDKVIAPSLAAGTWVLCDRFSDATFAYQAGGSGVAWDKVEALERWVHAGLAPDLTLYFDVPPAVARSRTSAIKSLDRFEQEREAFHARVREAYLRRAANDPPRIRVIEAVGSIAEVHSALEKTLLAFGLPDSSS
ncbi:MAG: dTMP kinase [Burkholderiales bacterium]